MGFPEIAFQAIQLGAGKRGERETYTREGAVDWQLAVGRNGMWIGADYYWI